MGIELATSLYGSMMPCHSIFIYGDGIELVNCLSSTTIGISLVNRFITFRAQLIHI